MINDRNDNPGQGQWRQEDESQRILSTQNRGNDEEFAENDKRGIDNPELNRDTNSFNDKDRDFDEDNEEEDENDDFHTNGLDEEHSLTDDENPDDDPNETKPYQERTGSDSEER